MRAKKYIVISEYDTELSKRQPWYSVSCFIDGIDKEFDCIVVNSLNAIPGDFNGEVVKIFSLKDIVTLSSFKRRRFKLTYFCSLPIYEMSNFYSLGLVNFFRNIKDLYRLVLTSLLPKVIIKKVFLMADVVIFISDETFHKFAHLSNALYFVPFKKGNWGVYDDVDKNKDKIAYMGPPFETRGFDLAIDLFARAVDYECKVITRIERDSLNQRLEIYKDNFSKINFVLGMLTREELRRELSDVKILVLPFRLVMSELPIVVLEAAELGIHIVTTAECGISKINGFPGVIIDKGDISLDVLNQLNSSFDSESFFRNIDEINSSFWRKYFGEN